MDSRWAGPVAVLIFLAAWLLLHPAEPWDPGGDVYDHLFVARNLLGGEGLATDVIYPLTTAWEWGRQLPQPMLHRPCGYSLLLTVPYLVVGGDPVRVDEAVRWLQIALLLGTVGIGWAGLRRRGAGAVGPAWLLLLLLNPLLALAVGWGWAEIACGLLLLLLWLRLREDALTMAASQRAAILTGLLVGSLTWLRTDLLWVPLLWAGAGLIRPRGGDPRPARPWRGIGLAALIWVLVTLPWWWHVAGTAGTPWFNPLSYSLQLDLSENWWEYPRLRGLQPQPALQNLREDFIPALVKVRHGIRLFAETLGTWLPWPVWVLGLWFGIAGARRRRTPQPLLVLGVTLAGLVLFYGLLSQEVRHLLVLLPVVSWEICLLAGNRLKGWRLPGSGPALVAMAFAAAAILLFPLRPEGDLSALASARRLAPRVTALAAEVADWPAGPVFTDNAAVCWLTGRRGVWSPYDAAVEAAIRESLPDMTDARWVRLQLREPNQRGSR